MPKLIGIPLISKNDTKRRPRGRRSTSLTKKEPDAIDPATVLVNFGDRFYARDTEGDIIASENSIDHEGGMRVNFLAERAHSAKKNLTKENRDSILAEMKKSGHTIARVAHLGLYIIRGPLVDLVDRRLKDGKPIDDLAAEFMNIAGAAEAVTETEGWELQVFVVHDPLLKSTPDETVVPGLGPSSSSSSS